MDTEIDIDIDIEADSLAGLTGQAANRVARALRERLGAERRENLRLRRELRDARDQANRYVVEAATLRLKLREAEALATAGVTLARYCETIGWNTGDARARAWLDGLSERIDAVTGREKGVTHERLQ
jgi:hypothetical protein